MVNPKVKLNEVIILKESKNGQGKEWLDIPLVVIKDRVTGSNNIHAQSKNGIPTGAITIYYSGPADTFILASRKEQAKYVKEKIVTLKEEIKVLENEVVILEKFDSEEHYVAYKIDKLLSAKGVNAKTKVLQELKQSNIL